MPGPNISDLDQLLQESDVKLEITGGIPTWEAFPSSRHQRTIDNIRSSIEPLTRADGGSVDCRCAHLSDISIRFKDGSFKRPDIAIFCQEPPNQDEALTIVPTAVIEIISPGYEYKDMVLNPQFYLAQGVLDVVIVDPRSGAVTHYTTSNVANHHAPVRLEMQCGCGCTVP